MSDNPQAATDRGEYIELQQALKLSQIVETGGEAKYLIQSGQVRVNGEPETRRRRKLYAGDSFEVGGETYQVGDG